MLLNLLLLVRNLHPVDMLLLDRHCTILTATPLLLLLLLGLQLLLLLQVKLLLLHQHVLVLLLLESYFILLVYKLEQLVPCH